MSETIGFFHLCNHNLIIEKQGVIYSAINNLAGLLRQNPAQNPLHGKTWKCLNLRRRFAVDLTHLLETVTGAVNLKIAPHSNSLDLHTMPH